MILSKIRFRSLSFLFVLGVAFLIWHLYIYSREPAPYGYVQAQIQTMHGRLVYMIAPGTRQYSITQYIFEDAQTGKLRKFYDQLTNDSIKFEMDKGKIFNLSVINDQILSCNLNGEWLCSPKCYSAPTCEALRIRIGAARENQSWWNTLSFLIIFSFLYFWKIWRNRPSGQA